MRHLHLALVALLICTSAPIVGAQETEWTTLLEDAASDVAVEAGGQALTSPERFGPVDLVSLRAIEGPETVTFALGVRSLDASTEIMYGESVDWIVVFTHHDMTYRLFMVRWTEAGDSGAWGYVEELDAGSGRWTYTGPADISVDEDTDTVEAVVERALLHDRDGAPPFPGRALTGVYAVGRHVDLNANDMGSATPQPTSVSDRMPDAGVGKTPMEFHLGLPQADDLHLASERPFRASNGAATTLIYEVHVENRAEVARPVTFSARDLPDGWSIRFPEPTKTLAAGESTTVDVLATVPFAHEHGAQRSFVLVAADDQGAAAHLELGLRFTDIPQPSGHHPRVWFHSTPMGGNLATAATAADPGPEQWLVFNAAEEYDWDTGDAVQASWQSTGTTEIRSWTSYLSPGLQMGLDFDLEGAGMLLLPIEANGPMQGLTATARLYHWATDDRTEYDSTIIFETTQEVGDWEAGQARTLEFPFAVRDDADRIDLRNLQGLTLQVFLTGPSIGPNAVMDPRIAPGGWMDLPLFEYHDAVEDVGGAGGIVLDAQGEVERLANPGETTVFSLRAHNGGPATTLTARVTGGQSAWARVVPSQQHVAAGGEATFQVAIEVPDDRPDGELVDLVIEVAAEDGATGLQRIRVLVDTDADHPDEADLLQETADQESPGPWVGAALLAAVVLARRRWP